jgi:hypothetical protein
MGTRKTNQTTKKIDCNTCGREYTPMCDFMQGRCPYHTALIDTNKFKTRFTNLLNFFKGNK